MTKSEQKDLILHPYPRIDSSNSRDFEQLMRNASEANPGCHLVLDFDEVIYISSAGLRAILTARKRLDESLEIINVSPEVYEIMEMTGFTDIMTVRKRLRNISIDGCEVIGRGGTGTVYRIDPDTIVKVYDIPDAIDMIRNELRNARKAFIEGIPTAISYDVVRVDEHYGIVYELLDASTFSDILSEDMSRIDEIVRMHVDVIKKIHSVVAKAGDFPDCREIFAGYIDEIGDAAPQALRDILKERIMNMPFDPHMIHGDMQMRNVMLCKGEPMLIDMDTLSTGDPVFEFANLFVGYRAFNEDDPANSLRVIGLPKDVCSDLFDRTLDLYYGPMDSGERCQLVRRIMILGYIRFLYLIVILKLGGDDLLDIRRKHAVEHLQELAGMTGSGGIIE